MKYEKREKKKKKIIAKHEELHHFSTRQRNETNYNSAPSSPICQFHFADPNFEV